MIIISVCIEMIDGVEIVCSKIAPQYVTKKLLLIKQI